MAKAQRRKEGNKKCSKCSVLAPARHSPGDGGCLCASVPFRAGFTLIELMVSMALLVIALGITFSTFYSISKAWQRGQTMAENLNRGEFIMEQIVCGLHSAFFPVRQSSSASATNAQPANTNAAASNTPATVSAPSDYGLILADDGDGATARDSISWVKTGSALLGPEDALWRGLHRVQITVEEDEDGLPAIATRVWRPYGNAIDFNPDEIEPFFISEKVIGINFRVAKEADSDEGWEWEDEWEALEFTNRLPMAVEVVLYLEPIDEFKDPVEIKRVVEIPVAPLSWSVGKTK